MARGMRVGDMSARYGASTGQVIGGFFSLHDFPAGALSDDDRADLGEQSMTGRVASGRFGFSEAAIGLVVGTILMLYLGSRVVVQVPK